MNPEAGPLVRRMNPRGMHIPVGYSQVVTVEGPCRLVFLGGKAGTREDRSFPPTLSEQADLAFGKVAAALAAAGAAPGDVVDLKVYIVDLHQHDPQCVYQAIRGFFPVDAKPASMIIGVSALARPGLLLELHVTAACPLGTDGHAVDG